MVGIREFLCLKVHRVRFIPFTPPVRRIHEPIFAHEVNDDINTMMRS